MVKVILFDLDGTLLPMDQDDFVNAYIRTFTKKLSKSGYETNRFIVTMRKAVKNMVENDGKATNEQVFWQTLKNEYGESILNDKDIFDEYYINDFQLVKKVCGFDNMSRCIIDILKANGYRIVLATNPLFPRIATESRMRWAGLDREDFELYTTYENSCYSKPNIKYYEEILSKINCKAEECLMVGNDINEDMVAREIGMKTFLLTNNIINKDNVSIDQFEKGNFNDLLTYIRSSTR